MGDSEYRELPVKIVSFEGKMIAFHIASDGHRWAGVGDTVMDAIESLFRNMFPDTKEISHAPGLDWSPVLHRVEEEARAHEDNSGEGPEGPTS